MGDETLTAAEQAAEEQRKQELARAIEGKDDTELRLFAKSLGVAAADDAKLTERADLVAAIELHEEAAAAEARQKVRDMEVAEAAKINGADDRRSADARAIRALNAEFCRSLPEGSRSGSFEPGDDPRFAGEYNAKDGKYRVVGSEWVFEIRKGALIRGVRATAENGYGGKNVIAVE